MTANDKKLKEENTNLKEENEKLFKSYKEKLDKDQT